MNRRQRYASQQGFTLVELIVVILILGILASVAVPKFVNMGQDARMAKISAVYGAMKAASQVTYGAALVRGSANSATGSVTTQSGTVTTIYGYPDTNSTTGIMPAAGFDGNTTAASNQDQLTISVASGVLTVYPTNAATPASCQVQYTPAASAAAAPTITLPASASSNC